MNIQLVNKYYYLLTLYPLTNQNNTPSLHHKTKPMNKEETIKSYMADINYACMVFGVTLTEEIKKTIELRLELCYLNGKQEQMLSLESVLRTEITIPN
jgi:hypothetical protein